MGNEGIKCSQRLQKGGALVSLRLPGARERMSIV
jgi:hypothetical protein